MDTRFIHKILNRLSTTISFCLFNTAVLAQSQVDVIKPNIDRSDVSYDRIDTENFELTPFIGLLSIEDFSSGNIIGARIAYHASENLFFEYSLGLAEGDQTTYEELSPGINLFEQSDREYTSHDISLGLNLFPGETWLLGKAFSSDFYLLMGAGRTEFGGKNWSSLNIGAGYRFYINDWAAVRLDFRDHIFNRQLFIENKKTHNTELSIATSFFF